MRRLLHISYQSHRWLLAQLGHQCNLRQHLHLKLLNYLTHAVTHSNDIANMLASIAMGCARSQMSANIASLRHYNGVSLESHLKANRKCINYVYKMANEQDATVHLLRELVSCRDGAFFIDYFNDDEVATLMAEICTRARMHDTSVDMV